MLGNFNVWEHGGLHDLLRCSMTNQVALECCEHPVMPCMWTYRTVPFHIRPIAPDGVLAYDRADEWIAFHG